MTVAFAISTRDEEGEVVVIAGCDSLTGSRNTISGHSTKKYVGHEDWLVFFSGHSYTVQRAQNEELIAAVLGEHGPGWPGLTGSLLAYHNKLLEWSVDKKEKETGLSGVRTLLVNSRTGDLITVFIDGSIGRADKTEVDEKTVSYTAIGCGAPMAIGVLYGMYSVHQVLEDWSLLDREAPLKCCELWDKSVGGALRTFCAEGGEWIHCAADGEWE